jgi:stage V sporulation protein AA
MDQQTIYVRLRQRVKVKQNALVTIGDLAQVVAANDWHDMVTSLPIHQIKKSDKHLVVIDVMKVIRRIQEVEPRLEVQMVGPAQTIVEILYPHRRLQPVYFVLVWFLLFVGAGLAIMNFHEDVSMQEVHQKIYYMITGNEKEYPLLLQIPYSLGLGVGMILFFNHLFRKKINEEPSPLEVEMFNYQQDLDQYVIVHENSESEKKLDDH